MMDILMVCTGNICRSPMAEGLLRHMLPENLKLKVHVHSAGTHGLDDQPAASFAIQAAAEMGVDIAGHRARSLDPEMVSQADLILVMEPFHREIVARVVRPEEGDRLRLLADFETPRQSDTIDDPYNHSLKVYRACLNRIRDCLGGVLPYLTSERQPND
jgi:low molecular weight protein-tyrosine phosphatase